MMMMIRMYFSLKIMMLCILSKHRVPNQKCSYRFWLGTVIRVGKIKSAASSCCFILAKYPLLLKILGGEKGVKFLVWSQGQHNFFFYSTDPQGSRMDREVYRDIQPSLKSVAGPVPTGLFLTTGGSVRVPPAYTANSASTQSQQPVNRTANQI